jgi:glycosyltransferase involved in cell wall biosynthesis
MKVLLDAHAAIQKKTGIGRYTDNLITYLPKMSKREISLSLYTHPPTPRKYFRFPSYQAPFKNGVFRVFWGLNRAILKLRPDIVHINNFAPIMKTCPIVVSVHDLCFKTHPKKYPLKNLLAFKLFFSVSLKKANAIICVSEAVKSNLLRLYEVNPDKVYVTYEAVDPIFGPIVSKRRVENLLKKKFGIKDKYFLVVGNIEPRKEPFGIIEAFKSLQKKYKDTSLVFAGPNLLVKKLSGKKIKTLGFVTDNDLNLLYNGSLSLFYFSSCEGFGLPLLEAMSCKTPVICSNLGVFKEIVKDSAIFVRSKKELVQGMERIIKDKNFRRKLSLKGYKQAKAFSWKKTAEETLEIYRQILGRT